jgi:hypothetical protein
MSGASRAIVRLPRWFPGPKQVSQVMQDFLVFCVNRFGGG